MNVLEKSIIDYSNNPGTTSALVVKLEGSEDEFYMLYLGFTKNGEYWVLRKSDCPRAVKLINDPSRQDYTEHWQRERLSRWQLVTKRAGSDG